MNPERSGFLTGVVSLAMSAALNGALLVGVEHAVRMDASRQELIQKEFEARMVDPSAMQFDFVEAPPKMRVKAPKESRRISDRDALSQDALGAGTTDQDTPYVKNQGPADQLSQKRGAAAPDAPALQPQEARPSQAPVPEAPPAQAAQAAAAPDVPAPMEPSPDAEKKEEPADTDSVTALAERPLEAAASPAQPAPDLQAPQAASPPAPSPRQAVQPQEALPASPPVSRLTGQDKIDTQEMARAVSKGSLLRGFTSFEATGSGMGEYMKNLKDKIWLKWFPYLSFKYPHDYESAEAVLRIRLDKNGEVLSVKLIEGGSGVFSAFCMEAVQRAAPYGPLPEEILALVGDDGLEITFSFHYF